MSEPIDKLKIKEFKLNMIGKHASIVVIAKRGSGKSFLCRALLDHFKNIPVSAIICETERFDPFYSKFFPESFIYQFYTSELIEKLLNRQLKIKEKNDELKKIGKRVDPSALILMDDCFADSKSWKNEPTIKELLFNGRHYKITYILAMQFPLGISPALRSNFDYIFLLADDEMSNQKRIFEHYAGIFPNFHAFRDIYSDLTINNGCMVLVNKGARSSFFDKLFWYKAPIVQPEYIGCHQFQQFHINNYNPNWSKKKKIIDVFSYCNNKKKNKEQIKVDKIEHD